MLDLDRPDSPATIDALLTRARGLAGLTIAALGKRVGHRVPRDLRGHKGFVGMCVELALGAKAKSSPEPDFPHLGIELKTIPVRGDGLPTESTYVCQASLDGSEERDWRGSSVYKKLARVLFVPIEDPPDVTLAKRRIGMPFLWIMGASEEAELITDWTMLSERIRMGELGELTTVQGAWLHLRPKAQTHADRTSAVGEDGWMVPMQPRAWYLRPAFTARLLARAFAPVDLA